MQGSLSNPLPANFSIKSSQVPQAGTVATLLGFPAADGDTIYQFVPSATGGAYVIHTLDLGEWSGGEPNIAVGESFFSKKVAAGNWTRTFSVNQ
jgi:hypothetical protein